MFHYYYPKCSPIVFSGLRQFHNLHIKLVNQMESLFFNHRCIQYQVHPPSLNVTPLVDTHYGRGIAFKASMGFVKARINLNHYSIKIIKSKIEVCRRSLEAIIDFELLCSFLRDSSKLIAIHRSRKKSHLCAKLQSLIDKNIVFSESKGFVGPAFKCNNLILPDCVVNLSSKVLSDDQIIALHLGSKFVPSSSSRPRFQYAADILKSLNKYPNQLSSVALSHVNSYLKNWKSPPANITQDQVRALRHLHEDPMVHITSADKGGAIVIMDMEDYVDKMNMILSDKDIFTPVFTKNHISKAESNLQVILYKAFSDKHINFSTYRGLKSVDAVTPTIYGLPKVHKPGNPLRPVLRYYLSPFFKVSKYLHGIIAPLVGQTDSHIHSASTFMDYLKTISIPSNLSLISFDVVNMYTSIQISSTLDILHPKLCSAFPFPQSDLSVSEVMQLLDLLLHSNFVRFGKLSYLQRSGLPMGNPLSGLLAGIFMEYIESIILSTYPIPSPLFWKCYADDILTTIPNDVDPNTILLFLNSVNHNISFSFELESDNSIPFLDFKITRTSSLFLQFSVYRKTSYSGNIPHFSSNTPFQFKISILNSFISRALHYSSTSAAYISEKNFIISILMSKGYPIHIISRHISKIESDFYNPSPPPIATIPLTNQNLSRIILPFHSTQSYSLRRYLVREGFSVSFSPLRSIKQIVFTPHKPTIVDHSLSPGLIYKFQCSDCASFYIGMTGRCLISRANDHFYYSRSADRGLNYSGLTQHTISCDHKIAWHSTSILDFSSSYTQRCFLEALHISLLQPSLNVQSGIPIPELIVSWVKDGLILPGKPKLVPLTVKGKGLALLPDKSSCGDNGISIPFREQLPGPADDSGSSCPIEVDLSTVFPTPHVNLTHPYGTRSRSGLLAGRLSSMGGEQNSGPINVLTDNELDSVDGLMDGRNDSVNLSHHYMTRSRAKSKIYS